MESIFKTHPTLFIDTLHLTLKLAPWNLANHAYRAYIVSIQIGSNAKPSPESTQIQF